MSQAALAAMGFVAGVVAILLDGRHALVVSCAVVTLGLAPTVAIEGGQPAVVMLLTLAASTALLSLASSSLAQRSHWVAGLDPVVPVVSAGEHLFGPRSVRVAAGALAVPAASWVSLNVPVGEVTVVQGLLFSVAYIWICGAARLLLARTLEDLSVATVMVALAGAVAWILRGGPDAVFQAGCLASLAPLAGLTAGWLTGRHHRPRVGAGAGVADP